MKTVRGTLVVTAILLFVFSIGLAQTPAPAGPTRLLRQPDIHADQVVFVYAGDLWTASAKGGSFTGSYAGCPGSIGRHIMWLTRSALPQ